jgi:hypothetical protein
VIDVQSKLPRALAVAGGVCTLASFFLDWSTLVVGEGGVRCSLVRRIAWTLYTGTERCGLAFGWPNAMCVPLGLEPFRVRFTLALLASSILVGVAGAAVKPKLISSLMLAASAAGVATTVLVAEPAWLQWCEGVIPQNPFIRCGWRKSS